uniref:Uncharacterized protein n=1 Tax=Vespula pensylvanica TaxID=30213 RepID=A0A834P807_VESPE|nr:hypothetical protein H0235_004755 [Vespula pensylvanica]
MYRRYASGLVVPCGKPKGRYSIVSVSEDLVSLYIYLQDNHSISETAKGTFLRLYRKNIDSRYFIVRTRKSVEISARLLTQGALAFGPFSTWQIHGGVVRPRYSYGPIYIHLLPLNHDAVALSATLHLSRGERRTFLGDSRYARVHGNKPSIPGEEERKAKKD